MKFVYNFPFFSIICMMVCGIISSILNGKNAARLNKIGLTACTIMNGTLLFDMIKDPKRITFMMGHFPRPWGNEIRFGPLEALLATVFCLVMLLVFIACESCVFDDVPERNVNLYFLMCDLLMTSLIALTYTNDLFTAYVFVEINTLTSLAIVCAKENGQTITATIRYLVMSLLGSGLFLISVILIYDLTGHLLMPNILQSMTVIFARHSYRLPITIIVGLLSVGLAMKSALFPFHSWLSHAHSAATTASSAILSSLVLKGYIVLLIKIYFRVMGYELVSQLRVSNVLFVFAVLAMIIGSIDAMQQTHIKKIIAFSSVAQMGYIYAGIAISTFAGYKAAFLHIIVHALTKSMLFASAGGLAQSSGHKYELADLRGAAYRNPVAGVAFVIGSLSMIGIPFFAGFGSKYYLAMSAFTDPGKKWFLLFTLAISTVLNAVYYVKVLLAIFSKDCDDVERRTAPKGYNLGLCLMIVANVALGLFYGRLADIIGMGLHMF